MPFTAEDLLPSSVKPSLFGAGQRDDADAGEDCLLLMLLSDDLLHAVIQFFSDAVETHAVWALGGSCRRLARRGWIPSEGLARHGRISTVAAVACPGRRVLAARAYDGGLGEQPGPADGCG